MHPSDFSLLVPGMREEQVERPDEDKMLMQKAAGLAGGVRSVGTEGAIFYRLRMWRMSWWMMPINDGFSGDSGEVRICPSRLVILLLT